MHASAVVIAFVLFVFLHVGQPYRAGIHVVVGLRDWGAPSLCTGRAPSLCMGGTGLVYGVDSHSSRWVA